LTDFQSEPDDGLCGPDLDVRVGVPEQLGQGVTRGHHPLVEPAGRGVEGRPADVGDPVPDDRLLLPAVGGPLADPGRPGGRGHGLADGQVLGQELVRIRLVSPRHGRSSCGGGVRPWETRQPTPLLSR
jgi:hypothetical protein